LLYLSNLGALVRQGCTLARKLGSEQKLYGSEMPKYVDLSRYWTEDKNLSIQKAREKTGLDKRTLSAAKKGQLERGQFETLFKLRDLASELAGKSLTLEEIFKDD
jgi:DNA-binding Xre family transcriptional regulator